MAPLGTPKSLSNQLCPPPSTATRRTLVPASQLLQVVVVTPSPAHLSNVAHWPTTAIAGGTGRLAAPLTRPPS